MKEQGKWEGRKEGGEKREEGREGGGWRAEQGGSREGLVQAQPHEVSTSHCQSQMGPQPPASRDPSLLKGTQVGCGAGSSWSNCCPGYSPGSCFSTQLSHHLSGCPKPTTGNKRPLEKQGLPFSIPQMRN